MPVWEESTNSEKCSNCGANIFFNEKFQKLTCRSCGSFFDPYTKELNFQLEIKDKGKASPDDNRVEYNCGSCGAVVVTDNTTAADICAFCGSPSIVKGRLRNDFKPDSIIPFKISKDEASKIFKSWASEYKRAPKDFASSGTVEKMQGVYVPFWLMDANCHLDYMKSYGDSVEYDFELKKVPFDGSHAIPDILMKAIEPFDYDELVPYSDGYLHGFKAQRYDESPVEMTDKIYDRFKIYLDEVYRNTRGEQEETFRNENFSYVGELKQQYALCPVWFLNYSYDGKKYQYAINGQTGEVQGLDVPYSKLHYGKAYTKKILSFIGIILLALLYAGITLACIFAIFTDFDDSEDMLAVILFGILLAVGRFFVIPLVKYLFGLAKLEIDKPVYHIIDRAPDANEYFDSSSIKKAKRVQRSDWM